MAVTAVFTGIPTAGLDAARAWYERVMGRPPDLIPNASEVAWEVAERAWIYVVDDADRAGSALLTILVDDLDARLAELAQRGIAPTTVEAIAEVGRKARIADPEGNAVTFAEVASAGERSRQSATRGR